MIEGESKSAGNKLPITATGSVRRSRLWGRVQTALSVLLEIQYLKNRSICVTITQNVYTKGTD